MSACPICSGHLSFFGETDFNRSAADVFEQKRQYPVSDEMVTYLRCNGCGFIKTDFFDDWGAEDFKNKIYNEDYHLADSPFEEERPEKLSRFLDQVFGHQKLDLKLLDYGGGTGRTVHKLQQLGFPHATSYDPFYTPSKPAGVFDVVTFFEVVEHVPDQNHLMEQIKSFCQDNTVLVFSTLLQPKGVDINWWYLGPRNGHLCAHTKDSLKRLMKAHGFEVESVNQEIHMARSGDSKDFDTLVRSIDTAFAVNDVSETNHKSWL